MRLANGILCAALLAALFTTVSPAGARAEGSAEYADGDGNSGGTALLSISPAFGDSLLEVDRTLNFNHGDGSSAGSDNEGGE